MKTVGILGNKWQMTHILSQKEGLLIPVTTIMVSNNVVSQVNNNERETKSKKMTSRMSNERVSQNSIIEKIDKENQIIFLRGAVPGPKRGLVILRKTV